MKMLKKSIVVLCMLILAATFTMYGCGDKEPTGTADVASIECTNTETSLAPGDYKITAKCLPKNSPQAFTAKLNGSPRNVSMKSADGAFTLTVGANAINGSKITVKVISRDDPSISSTKDFKLAIPEPTYKLISDEAGLIAIADDLSGNYKLTCDITLTKDWIQLGDAEHQPDNAPIVPSVNPFKGILDGNGYSIKNLRMKDDSATTGYDRGFFGRIDGSATVRNIGFEGGKVDIRGWSGVIAAQNFGTIMNVFTNVEVTTLGGVAAAFVVTNAGTIENCYAIGAVNGPTPTATDKNTSGFIGVLDGGVVQGCFADRTTTKLKYFCGGHWNQGNEELNSHIISTDAIQTAQTFKDAGWDETRWNLVDGEYPTLKHI